MALDFGKLNFSTSFNPTSAFPIDARTYFESLEAAQAAAATAEEAGSSNTTYYYGQILTVNESGAVSAYQINGDKTLIKLAETTASGDLEGDIIELQGKVAALETTVGNAEKGLVKDVADLQNETATISGTLSTLSESLGTLSGQITTLSTRVDGVETTLEGTTNSLETLSTQVQDVTDNVATLSSGLTGLTASVTTNTQTISALSTRLTTAEGDIDALQNQIGGLTGAMHFIGTSSTDPAEGATVPGHEEFVAGDVCLYEGKEYVWDGATWQELGDEGSHLTKTEAADTYVKKTFTVNGQALSGTSITLSAADVNADATGAAEAVKTELSSTLSTLSTRVDQLEADKVVESDITDAIGALTLPQVTLSAGETLATIEQNNGVVTVSKQSIAIAENQVTGLTDSLAAKQDKITLSTNGIVTISDGVFGVDTNAYQTSEQVQETVSQAIEDLDLANTYLGLHAKADTAAVADKVANILTVGGKTFDGSAAVEVTATDLGALTAVPQATTEALGGIKLGHTEGTNEHAVQLDAEGKAYVTVSIPAAVTYSAGAGLTLSDNTFNIAAGGVTNEMLAGSITDDKIVAVNVQKLTQSAEDVFILDGGKAE